MEIPRILQSNRLFSMDTKEAASDSLCIILISQAASLLIGALINSLPDVNLLYVFVMIVGGLGMQLAIGSAIGSEKSYVIAIYKN